MADYTKRPIRTAARKNELCAETNKMIKKGQSCWFNVKTKLFYCENTAAARVFANSPNSVFEQKSFN